MRTEPPTPCPPSDRLRDYLRGRVSDEQLDAVAEHLKACPACLARLDRLDRSEAPLGRPGGSSAAAGPADPALDKAVRRLLGPSGFRPDRPADPPMPGDRLGEYRLLEKIGEGGMGATYKALHARLEMVVALKVLRPAFARDPASAARFHREMRAIGRLRHPNIVQATDAGEAGGLLYLAMEHVTGETLSARVRRGGSLPVPAACRVVRSAARALQHAHAAGLVHRDVKPSNLMLAEDGTVKLLDLGLALLHRAAAADGATDPMQLSAERGVVGTNDYMAPEQWRNASKVDARADQYSLGCTLYYLLAGEPPFARHTGQTPYDKMEAHLTHPAPDPSGVRPEVTPELGAIVRRMLAKAPEGRFPSLAEVIDALGPFAGEPDSAERTALRPAAKSRQGWIAVGAALAAVAAGAALWRPLFGTPAVSDPPAPEPPAQVVKTRPPPGRLPMTLEQAQTLQARWADYLDRPVAERNPLGMDLVLIPPGEYEPARVSPVTLSQPFDLGRTEVTHAQFARFVAETGYQTTAERLGTGSVWSKEEGKFLAQPGLSWRAPGTHDPAPDHPVVFVTWTEARAFCDWLTAREGRKYRLPTEWEWQWACRAGSDQQYFHFTRPGTQLSDYAWHQDGRSARPVAQLLPNAWGAFDVLGNVHEWTLNYQTTLPGERSVDPRGPVTGSSITVCGGGFDTTDLRCNSRLRFTPNFRWHKVGFRVLREQSVKLAGD
jgi:formylglycine-generating enzyme required for sulfatase activity